MPSSTPIPKSTWPTSRSSRRAPPAHPRLSHPRPPRSPRRHRSKRPPHPPLTNGQISSAASTPVVVHFPIALLLTAALLELFSLAISAQRLRDAARACLVLGAIGAAFAAVFGWISAEFNTFSGPTASTLLIHRWLGVVGASSAILTLLLLFRGPRALAAYRFFLFGTAAIIGVGSHFGGTLVHGDNYLFAAFSPAPSKPVASKSPAPVPSKSVSDLDAKPPAPSKAAADSDSLSALLFATNDDRAFAARRKLRLASVPAPASPADADHAVDAFIAAKWKADGLPQAANPPELCDDATFLRRVYLDILGLIPTVAESDRFLSGTDPAKREKIIDELLARDDDYAAHWTPFWEDALASANTTLQGGVPTRGNYREWIYSSFYKNKPFDVMVAELIDPSMPGHQAAVGADANGKVSQVGYIKSETHTDTLQSAANIAQVFLGTSMKCASCHSHFENPEWPQKRFLAFAGILSDHDLEVIRCEKHMGETVAAAFPFNIPGAPTDLPTDSNGRLRRLSQLLTDPANPRFASAIVNRLWKRYLGLGLFEPADDFRLDRPPSHPELLNWLAYDFMQSGYDLKHTIRRILTSRAYQSRYDPALEDHFDITKPTMARYYRSPSLRRLTAEQLIDSVRVATSGASLPQGDRLFRDNTSTALTRSLGRPASRNEISTARPDDVAVVQSLELLNGEDYQSLIASGPLAGNPDDPAATITRLYRAALTRPPTKAELDLAVEFFKSSIDRATPPTPAEPTEEIILDDNLPDGAMVNEGEWPWVSKDNAPVFSGDRAHRQKSDGKKVQHYYLGATHPIAVGSNDTLYAYAFIDTADPPAEIMLQFNDGEWDHRAFWGTDKIMFGSANSPSRRRLGDLPQPGKWIRLEVPAGAVGLGRGKIGGLSFDQFGGTVTWDKSGIVHRPPDPAAPAMADLAWALFTSPEFQYIR